MQALLLFGGGKRSEARCIFQRPDVKRKLVKWLKDRECWEEADEDCGEVGDRKEMIQGQSEDAMMKGEMGRHEKQKETAKNRAL